MKFRYAELKAAFDGFLAENISPDALKAVAAPFGIYQQRNGNFMIRVRVNGGEIDCARLSGLAAILQAVGGQAHLTSRQDIQLHDVAAPKVMEAVWACDRLGLPFKGGGGNTYRNTVVGADSGLSPETVFDVFPYAHALNRAMQRCEKAFALPRKFKIGFFAGERDLLQAAAHDMGFVAQIRDGRKGFRVYAGGGLGRESSVGICLVEFLPSEQALKAALALVSLFYDHGDRANRQQARLRFLLRRIGAEAFMRLFLGYYVATDAPRLRVRTEGTALPSEWDLGTRPNAQAGSGGLDEGFALWQRFAVLPTRFGASVLSVRLFVPHGNLTSAHLQKIAALAREAGSPAVSLLTSQDVLIPFVRQDFVTILYARLRRELNDIDLTFRSYKGHIVTCVGASVCKIGMVDAPAVADRLAEALDHELPADTAERLALLKLVADGVRISGCPNACSGHPAARLGIGCINQRLSGDVRPFARMLTGAGVVDGVPRLSADESGKLLPVDELVTAAAASLLQMAGVVGTSVVSDRVLTTVV